MYSTIPPVPASLPETTPSPRRPVVCVVACYLAVVSVVLAGCGSHPDRSGGAAQGGPASDCSDWHADEQAVLKQLTRAIQKKDRKAWLAQATARARPAMQRWWDNLAAIGWETGAVGSPVEVSSDSTRKTVEVVAGVHNTLDAYDTESGGGKGLPAVPGIRYRTSLVPSADCKSALLDGWEPMQGTPWDSIPKLYVVKSAHAVVAGPPDAEAQIDQAAPVAEKAAVWLRGFFQEADKVKDMHENGFVTFVTNDDASRIRWFVSTKYRPKGWTADPNNLGGTATPLMSPHTLDAGVSALPSGGSRIILNPAELRSPVQAQCTLVHEFVHANYAIDDVWSWGSDEPIPPWVVEGLARWVEAFCHDTAAGMGRGSKSFPFMKAQLATQFGLFKGQPPTAGQIYGAANEADFWYDVSASVYSWLAYKWGLRFAVQTALLSYSGKTTPFNAVVKSNSGSKLVFEDGAQMQTQWASWLRQQIR
jgi:hypothetical protein